MTTSAPIVRNAGEGDQRAFFGGGLHTWKLLAEECDGAFFLFDEVLGGLQPIVGDRVIGFQKRAQFANLTPRSSQYLRAPGCIGIGDEPAWASTVMFLASRCTATRSSLCSISVFTMV